MAAAGRHHLFDFTQERDAEHACMGLIAVSRKAIRSTSLPRYGPKTLDDGEEVFQVVLDTTRNVSKARLDLCRAYCKGFHDARR